ncbi:hypothetical protein QM787_26385 [Rhodococcus ruber]|uniref:AbiTii domain-containing protein n=1 Tax=Rhodococcus ruber TaxID=1830 RepID=A0A098BRC5_9NOCA|nr:hypothetical protein [Rhodococcus ruber]MCD2130035.1 hypothetical protein [Rhodococcus ruber]MCZ4506513.1 hypothetical protein [Rhodococcus ruber]MCZ4533726.1 hypothetical protein [Rhodococcus ruber]MCZ4623964.1 hypothetical protein [Rhodococcus ruber]MDI9985433.1 hypothetical protein [Rhodococcus ruber]
MTDADVLRSLRDRVLDESEPVASLLRACLMLGAATGSEDLRTWARRELRGYVDEEDVPAYRQLSLPLFMDTVSGNSWATGQAISALQIPQKYREFLPERVSFKQSVEELEAMATADDSSLKVTMQGLPAIAAWWSNDLPMFQGIRALYYQVGRASLAGMVGRVRTTLVEMVADMTKDVPMNELPSKNQVDSAVQVNVYGSQDQYTTHVGTNSGVIGQGTGSQQTQTNNGVSPGQLSELIAQMRSALGEVVDDDDRAEVEQAIDDFEEAVTSDAEPEKVRRRARVLQRVGSAVGGALLSAAVAEGTQLALQTAGVT